MRLLDALRAFTRSWLNSRRIDSELAEELRFHLDTETEANVRRGMSPDDARRAAHRTLGNVEEIKEASREARPGQAARQLLQDIAYACRLLRKAPGFAAAAILIVALGIGATTAIFSVVYGVALRPLPYRDPERLVSLWTHAARFGQPRVLVNAADQRDWRAYNRVLEDIALVRPIANFNLVGAGEPERLLGARISANLLPVLGVRPLIGRGFTEDEDEIGRDHVVLLSHGLWRRRFAGDPSVVGRTISLSGTPHTVLGVMRPDFQYPSREFQVWTPLTIDPRDLARAVPRSAYNFLAVGRLRPGVSREAAQEDMDGVARRVAADHPENRDVGIEVVGMLADAVRPVRTALFLLLGAVLCLLLIASLNLANLLGARARSRAREFAVRLALGASRRRLALQALAEVVPLLAIGGTLGLGLARAAVAAFVPLAPATLPRAEAIELSGGVLAFSAALLLATGLLAGLLPAAQGWRVDLTQATQENGRGSTGGRRHARAGQVLVVAQVALAVPLLVGSVLLARSFASLTRVHPGFRADNVLSLHLAIPRTKYPGDPKVAAAVARFVERVAAVPGVASVGMVNRLPLSGIGQMGMIEIESPGAEAPPWSVDWRTVTPDYFATLGIPLREGRRLTEADHDAAAPVALVDEQLARAQWPGQSALGKRFRIAVGEAPWTEIVGVVGHVRHDGLDADHRAQVYWSYRQRTQDRMVMVVRSHADVRGLTAAIVAAIRSVDPEQPVYDVRTMEDVVERSLGQRRLSTALLGAFAVVALALASVGVYGVVAYGVTSRVREFGIRIALGAERAAVTRLVLRQGAELAGLGTFVGLGVALALGGALESLVFGVASRDAASLGLSALLLFGVALLASYLPARRAASVDPAVTLRCD